MGKHLQLSHRIGKFQPLRISTRFLSSAKWAPIIALGCLFVLQSAAQAQLRHRYSFTSDASDSVGTAHGTIVDAGTTPNFTFHDGQIDLSANAGQGSNGITEDAYVDLPNLIVSSASAGGTSGAITFEFWATVSTQRTWQRFGDFGTSNNGEDTSSSGSTAQYVLITPNSGRYGNGLEITNHPASNAAEPNVGLNGPFPVGTEQHVIAVYDHNNKSAGPNGTMTMYLNGVQIGQNLLHADFNMNNPIDNNNWLGRSQWNDPVFDGLYNEFRIYDQAASANYARRSFNKGPDTVVPFPPLFDLALIVNQTTGETMLKNVTDEQDSPISVSFGYYLAESETGALSTGGWNSLSDQGIGGRPEDVDGSGSVGAGDIAAWKAAYGPNAGGDTDGDGDSDGTDFLAIQRAYGLSGGDAFIFQEAGGGTANSVAELNLSSSLTLAPGESVSLGNLYMVGGTHDIKFSYAAPGGANTLEGDVRYVTSLSASASVPEPSTLIGLVAANAILLCQRRRRV